MKWNHKLCNFKVNELITIHLRTQRKLNLHTLLLYFLCSKNICNLPSNASNVIEYVQLDQGMRKIWIVLCNGVYGKPIKTHYYKNMVFMLLASCFKLLYSQCLKYTSSLKWLTSKVVLPIMTKKFNIIVKSNNVLHMW
jgi:hypothetical protein